jgi:hypothetical protein
MHAHVWTLSWFDPVKEHLIGSKDFPHLSDPEVAQILAVADEDVLSGEFPMDETRADRFHLSTGHVMHVDRFDYFLGATASSPGPRPSPID